MFNVGGAAFDDAFFNEDRQPMSTAAQDSRFDLGRRSSMSRPSTYDRPAPAEHLFDSTPPDMRSRPLPYPTDRLRPGTSFDESPLYTAADMASGGPGLGPYGRSYDGDLASSSSGLARPSSSTAGPSILKNNKNVEFKAKLSRTRDDEERRGEAPAGSNPGPRDISATRSGPGPDIPLV